MQLWNIACSFHVVPGLGSPFFIERGVEFIHNRHTSQRKCDIEWYNATLENLEMTCHTACFPRRTKQDPPSDLVVVNWKLPVTYALCICDCIDKDTSYLGTRVCNMCSLLHR